MDKELNNTIQQFDSVSDKTDKRTNYEVSQECAVEWIRGSTTATVTFPGNTKYASKIRKLAIEYPEEVQIKFENKDNSIVATVPVKYISIRHPKVVNREYTEEEKEKLRERVKKMQEARRNK